MEAGSLPLPPAAWAGPLLGLRVLGQCPVVQAPLSAVGKMPAVGLALLCLVHPATPGVASSVSPGPEGWLPKPQPTRGLGSPRKRCRGGEEQAGPGWGQTAPLLTPSASTWLSRPRATPESEAEGAGAWKEASTGLGLSLRPIAPSLPGLFTEPSPRGNFKPSRSPEGTTAMPRQEGFEDRLSPHAGLYPKGALCSEHFLNT